MLKKLTCTILLKLFFLFCLWFATQHPASADDYDLWGGWKKVTGKSGLFFTLQEIDGKWWFITPGGNAFLSKGVNKISYWGFSSPDIGKAPYHDAVEQKYGNEKAWLESVKKNLNKWGFNTIGADSSKELMQQQIPYTVLLDIGLSAGANRRNGKFPDVFEDGFRFTARRIAQSECRSRKDNVFLIGYFTDSDLHWIPDGRRKQQLLYDYLAFSKNSAGYQKALFYIKEHYQTIQELNLAWKTTLRSFDEITISKNHAPTAAQVKDERKFLEMVAEQYFHICTEAIRACDPNHLILGCRFDELAPEPVLNVMKKYADAVSLNTYQYPPPLKTLEAIHRITEKPVMISEFSLKAADSGLPNTVGRGYVCTTQQDRANGYNSFVEKICSLPFMVGFHWFSYMDEPPLGRWDGENNNYGLVNNQDIPWNTLTDQMALTNRAAESIHIKKE